MFVPLLFSVHCNIITDPHRLPLVYYSASMAN